jgi:hypothetical protein
MVIVGTSDGRLHAYDHSSTSLNVPPPLIWEQTLGQARYQVAAPANATAKPRTNIPLPVGLTSTPVVDERSRRIFAVAHHQEPNGSGSYWIYALDVDTGSIMQSVPLFDPGNHPRLKFDGYGLDQRGGLTLFEDRVFAVFSDLYAYDLEAMPAEGMPADARPAHPSGGWIASCRMNDLRDQSFTSVTTNVDGGGMWSPGGASVDARGRLYAATGTGLYGVKPSSDVPDYWANLGAAHPGENGDYFMGVVQFVYQNGSMTFPGWYQPGTTGGTGHDVKCIQLKDNDLGSCSVLVLPPIGGRNLVLTASKDGDVYLLDADQNLGGYDGHVDRKTVMNQVFGAPAYWATASEDHVVFVAGDNTVAAIRIAPPPPGQAGWLSSFYAGGLTAPFTFPGTQLAGPPVVAATRGAPDADALVWVAAPGFDAPGPNDNGLVHAISASDGTVVFCSKLQSDAVGPLPHFPCLTAIDGFVFVGTCRGFVCYENVPPRVRLVGFDAQGISELEADDTAWAAGWDLFFAGDFLGNGREQLVLYGSANGGAIVGFADDGTKVLDKEYPDWSRTWTLLVKGRFVGNGQEQLFFYDASTGGWAIFGFAPDGTKAIDYERGGFARTWTNAVPGQFLGNGRDQVLLYNRVNGQAAIVGFADDGSKSIDDEPLALNPHWTALVIGAFLGNGRQQVLLYNRVAGGAKLVGFAQDGTMTLEAGDPSWAAGWDVAAAGAFLANGQDQLFLYDQSAGRAAIVGFGPGGTKVIDAEDPFWSKTWTVGLTTVGAFLGNGRDQVFLYDQDAGLWAIVGFADDGTKSIDAERPGLDHARDRAAAGSFVGNGRDQICLYHRG